MITRIIGDLHGKWNSYQKLIGNSNNIDNSIQLGDFGVGFFPPQTIEELSEFLKNNSGSHRFIRGNHDNPHLCKNEMYGYIQDGTVENEVMYVGGAWSIDQSFRTPGVDWWEDEQCSYNELSQFIDKYEKSKPRIMITHDCPTIAAYRMFVRNGNSIGGKSLHLTRTGEALQQMFEIHKPDFWFFGHWHNSYSMEIDNTVFVCLNELDYIDVDFNDRSQMKKSIEEKFKRD